MQKSIELITKRNQSIKAMEDLVNSRQEAGKAVTEEEWSNYDADQKSLQGQIRGEEFLEKQRAAKATDIERNQERLEQLAPEQISEEKRYLDAFANYFKVGEKGLRDEDKSILEKRGTGNQTTTVGEGGYMIPEGFSNQLFTEKAKWGGMFEAAYIWTTPDGRAIPWPKLDDTGETGELVAEEGAMAIGDMAFTALTFNAYMYSSKAVKASIQLLQDSYFALQDILVPAFGRRLGTIQNLAFTSADGSAKPKGIVTASGSGLTSGASGAVTRTELNSLKYSIDPAYRMGEKFGYMMNDTTLGAISAVSMGTAASDNGPLWKPATTVGGRDTINGLPVFINQDLANMATTTKSILCGDFSQYKIRKAGGTTVRRLDELYALNNLVAFVAFERVDGDLLATNAVKYITQV